MLNFVKNLLAQLKNRKSDNEIESNDEMTYKAEKLERHVHYEYPKGNFRFPLIPDEQTVENKSNQVRQLKQPNNKQLVQIKRDVRPQIQEQKKGPFHPKKLPEPYYGLNKIIKKDEPVEYELSSFMTESLVLQCEKEETIIKDEIGLEVVLEKKDSDEQRIETELVPLSELQTGFYEETELDNIDEPTTYVENHVLCEETSSEVYDNAETSFEEHIKTDLINESSEVNKEEALTESVVLDDNLKLEEIKTDNLDEHHLLADMSPHAEIQNNNLEETSPNREVKSKDKVYKKDRKIVKTTNKFSNIPYNVLMLSGDKEKITSNEVPQNTNDKKFSKDSILHVENYEFPSFNLLNPPIKNDNDNEWIEEQTNLLNETMANFRVAAQVVKVTQGPAVTRFELYPDKGVKVNKITNLSDDIKLSLAAHDIRIEAPIPGKRTIGIEIPNEKSRPVLLSEIIQSDIFKNDKSPLSVALGLDISGRPIITDLRKMPHGLIAGATGSGKSVCINTMLISLLYKATPDELKLLLIDPKMVELAPYNDIPHLLSPVITDVKAATAALKWAVEEMERRYQLFAHSGARDISRFNKNAEKAGEADKKLPYIVIIIDELADLMMMSPADVEESICRIAQKARACGIHLIIATQRPSVDVITGLIKANIPTRIAFSVSSQADSRTVIDVGGAERLLGRGDMLFSENGSGKLVRLQGTFVSDDEVDDIVSFVKEQGEANYLFEQEQLLKQSDIADEDELFYDVCKFIIEQGTASTSSLQRQFRIGYNRAARLIDSLEEQGFITESRGSRPRDVLLTEAELDMLQQ